MYPSATDGSQPNNDKVCTYNKVTVMTVSLKIAYNWSDTFLYFWYIEHFFFNKYYELKDFKIFSRPFDFTVSSVLTM